MSSNISEERARAREKERAQAREKKTATTMTATTEFTCATIIIVPCHSLQKDRLSSLPSPISLSILSLVKKRREREKKNSFPRFFFFEKEDFSAIHFLHIDIFLTILLRLVCIQTHERTKRKPTSTTTLTTNRTMSKKRYSLTVYANYLSTLLLNMRTQISRSKRTRERERGRKKKSRSIMIMMMALSSASASDRKVNEQIYHSDRRGRTM